MGPSGSYTMFSLDGSRAGAAYTLNAEQKSAGVPPHWGIYISVEDADATTERASKAGGRVHAGPFDVMEHGRMSVIGDPAGAVFQIWQPKQHPGVGVSGVDGTVCWADLTTPDVSSARDFYSQLFGWEIKLGEHDSSGYYHIYNGSTPIGGIPPTREGNPAPPHWMLYFQVSDCAATEAKAKSLGATELMSNTQIPNVGSMAILRDPQGAVFALFQAAPRATA